MIKFLYTEAIIYFKMPKKNSKNNWRVWLIVILIILGVLWFFGIFSNDSGEKRLKEKYDVLEYLCYDSFGSVEMKSLGNREDQIRDALSSLYQDCHDSERYSITILESTKECFYSFNGEVIRIVYDHVGEDNFVIPESSKKIIESDDQFSFWKIFAKASYEFEMKNDISNMTGYQFMLSSSYKDYLENGMTRSTLYSIMAYEMDFPDKCK